LPSIKIEDNTYEVAAGESVLSCLERNGIMLPASCRSGVCQACIVRAEKGNVHEKARGSLKDTQRAQGYFLACVCYPEEDLHLVRANVAERQFPATIHSIDALNETVMRVRLDCQTPPDYCPGQFMNFVRPEGVVRSFSVASLPALYEHLEFHIAHVPNGKMSGWIHNEAKPGDALHLMGPLGDCFYVAGNPTQPLLLIGTGTGLAPLYGILRDALHQNHTGDIHLLHGGLHQKGLYLADELSALERQHQNFHYHPCVLNGPADDTVHVGTIDALAKEKFPTLKDWRIFLCGDPSLVKKMQQQCFLSGASLKDIQADAFLPAGGTK
jgi:CDP-4-dehydro-6-deoxyglucose reductase